VDGKKQTLTGEALNAWKYQRYLQDYLACVQSIDDNVGRLLDWLDQNGLSKNTVVIYTSDRVFSSATTGCMTSGSCMKLGEDALHRPLARGDKARHGAGGDGDQS